MNAVATAAALSMPISICRSSKCNTKRIFQNDMWWRSASFVLDKCQNDISHDTLTLSFSPNSPTDRRLLVLLNDLSLKSSHSLSFSSLQSHGFSLHFKLADDPSLSLHCYGQYLYDVLILFCSSVHKFGGVVDLGAVLDFVDSGHDLISVADDSAFDFIKSIVTECGVDFNEDPSALVIDHGSYAVLEIYGDHTLIAVDDFIESDIGSTELICFGIFKSTKGLALRSSWNYLPLVPFAAYDEARFDT